MCDRSFALVIFLILKVIILLVLPIIVYILYRKENKLFDTVGIVNIIFILFLIILRLFGNECITNSSISYLKNKGKDLNYVEESSLSEYESVYSTDQYLNQRSEEVYQYGIGDNPLRNVRLSCDKVSYMRNYGDSIAAITSLISNYAKTDINIIDVIDELENRKLIDCNNGFNFDSAINAIADMYSLNVSQISSWQVNEYEDVLVETTNKPDENNNFGCEKDYIVIYNTNGDEYSILNPNDKTYSYFCPSNTIGYGSIIEGNQNERAFTLEEINSKALRYFVVEVR